MNLSKEVVEHIGEKVKDEMYDYVISTNKTISGFGADIKELKDEVRSYRQDTVHNSTEANERLIKLEKREIYIDGMIAGIKGLTIAFWVVFSSTITAGITFFIYKVTGFKISS